MSQFYSDGMLVNTARIGTTVARSEDFPPDLEDSISIWRIFFCDLPAEDFWRIFKKLLEDFGGFSRLSRLSSISRESSRNLLSKVLEASCERAECVFERLVRSRCRRIERSE